MIRANSNSYLSYKPLFYEISNNKWSIGVCLLLLASTTSAQLPKSGTYKYDVAFAEQDGKSLGSTVTVIISADSITIINNGSLPGQIGEIIEAGKIIRHKATKQWIIATKPEDEFSQDIGGCSEGPRVIDFKNKKWWTC